MPERTVFRGLFETLSPDTIRPGRHTAFNCLPHTEVVTDVEHAKMVPQITNTKSLQRWYFQPFFRVTDSYEVPQVQKYDPAPLLSLRGMFQLSGTVYGNPHLWIEQAILMLIFTAVSVFLVYEPSKETLPVIWKAFNEKDADIRSFCTMLSTMATFLLSFFTSLNLTRWWRFRTEGIGNVWSSTSQLSMFLSEYVTRDEVVLSSVRRYARASLMLVFMKQRGYLEELEILTARGLLTAEEVVELRQWKTNLAESIWTWNAHIIQMLNEQGLIKSEQQLVFLLERVNTGRAGVATIGGQLGTPLPYQYVHFIGWMVKLHNVVLAALMGTIMAGNVYMERWIMCATILVRVWLIPMLYNAILLINEDIMDPFSGDLMDFPMRKYDEGIESDCKSYVDAGRYLPEWMAKWEPSGIPDPPRFEGANWSPGSPEAGGYGATGRAEQPARQQSATIAGGLAPVAEQTHATPTEV